MSLKDFEPNSANFVMCNECLFFIQQRDLLNPRLQGYCKNEYLYRMATYYKKYLPIFDPKHESCGCSLPYNTKIKPDEYFSRDNSAEDTAIRNI